jgi:exosortase C (VPDSG-CTERM-specific)
MASEEQTQSGTPRSGPRASDLALYLAFLTALFAVPLSRLALYAARSDLHSHVLLVPLVTVYLLYLKRGNRVVAYKSSIIGALVASAGALGASSVAFALRGGLSVNDELALMALAFVGFVLAGIFLVFGTEWMAPRTFALAFLAFMAPLPDVAVDWLEQASVLASAETAALFFKLTGTVMVRDGVVFGFPGFNLEVAQECSGIHSSWALFIASTVLSHLLLKTRWRRILVVAFVIPLGILRNGFRIAVIGWLCVWMGPHMIDSVIHRNGGPLFFVLSLVPLFLLLWFLRRQEERLKPEV